MRELAEKLHVRRLSIQKRVEAGLFQPKRNGRIRLLGTIPADFEAEVRHALNNIGEVGTSGNVGDRRFERSTVSH